MLDHNKHSKVTIYGAGAFGIELIAVTSPKTSDSILRSLKQYSTNEGKIRSICQKKISYRYLRQDFFETD